MSENKKLFMLDNKKFRFPILLLSFGILFCIVSVFATMGSTENWFARSGAILTFVSVVVQFLLSNLRKEEIENLFNSGVGIKEKFKSIKKKNPLHETIYIISGITGLVGTLIWGYGDLLF